MEFEESATSETGPANDNNDRKRECYYSFPAGLETEESVVSGMGPINDHNDGKRQDYHLLMSWSFPLLKSVLFQLLVVGCYRVG